MKITRNSLLKILLFFLLTPFFMPFTQVRAQVNYIKERSVSKPGVQAKYSADQLTSNTEVQQRTLYMDGLGRPAQDIYRQFVPDGTGVYLDLITPHAYDEAGRETKKYLPFAVSGTGGFNSNPMSAQSSFYAGLLPGEQGLFSQKDLDNSPLNRVLKSLPEGQSWVGSGKGVSKQYLFNAAGEVYKLKAVVTQPAAFNISISSGQNGLQTVTYTWTAIPGATTAIRLYRPIGAATWTSSGGSPVSPATFTIPIGDYEYGVRFNYTEAGQSKTMTLLPSSTTTSSLESTGTYAAGQLFKIVTVDEQGHQVVEFKNFDGKVVLKQTQKNATPGSTPFEWLNTYYVYDDFGLLRYILPPKASEEIISGGNLAEFEDQLCFKYEYDHLQRVNVRKVPGSAEERMVYNARGQLILSQDGKLRADKKWKYILYDDLGRETETGLWLDNDNYNNLSYHAQMSYNSVKYPDLTGATVEVLTKKYYDSYEWVAGTGVASVLDATYLTNQTFFSTSAGIAPEFAEPLIASYKIRGMLTGMRTALVGAQSAGNVLYKANFYDYKNRLIQVQSVNHTGGKDIQTNQYSFSGKLLNSLTQHAYSGTNGAQVYNVGYRHTLDPIGRVLTTRATVQKLSGGVVATSVTQQINSNNYDKLGRLASTTLGTDLESLNYEYNIRGWLMGINRTFVSGAVAAHYFGEEIAFDKSTSIAAGNSYRNPSLNGNIGGVTWKSKGDGVNRKYDFTYDAPGRLISADFLQNTSGTTWDKSLIDFSVSGLEYDANGNIQKMNQKGYTLGASSTIDQLTYSYENFGLSNKLKQVHDAANNEQTKLGDFHYSGT